MDTVRITYGSLCGGVAMVLVLALSTGALLLPWWTTAAAALPSPSSAGPAAAASSFSGTLWGYEASLPPGTAAGNAGAGGLSRRRTWDEACAAAEVGPGRCAAIGLIRTFVLSAAIIALVGCALQLVAFVYTSLVSLLGGMVAIALAAGSLGVGLFVAVTQGTDGLNGAGPICMLAAIVCAVAGCAMIVYAAAKAMQVPLTKHPEGEDRSQLASRLERVRAARRKEEAAEADGTRRTLQLASPRSQDSAAPTCEDIGHAWDSPVDEDGTSSKAPSVDLDIELEPVMLKRVLDWISDEAGVTRHDLPTDMLVDAFVETDEDGSGCISLSELGSALRRCGLGVKQATVARIMAEVDKDNSGEIDLFEFVEFFRMVLDVNNVDEKSRMRAQYHASLSVVCFFFLLVVISVLCVRFSQQDTDDSDSSSGGSEMLMFILVMCVLMLSVLFCSLIVIPICKLTLGPSVGAWVAHCKAWARHCASSVWNWRRGPRGNGGGDPEPAGPEGPRTTAWAEDGATEPAPPALDGPPLFAGVSEATEDTAATGESMPRDDKPAKPALQPYGSPVGGGNLVVDGPIKQYDRNMYEMMASRSPSGSPQTNFNPMSLSHR
mmetsp:Transcript_86471/g.245194  ORF Transcript_86471/g.245194 Transcript_86471/m.245194 type:complete len:605 (+) Transcript_86471:59-1873(+)